MDLPILKYLDVLIGLAVVMLLGCTVVAAGTQLITSTFYLRAQYLRQGLADLLQQLDPTANAADCQYAAQLLQRHPLVSRPATLPGQLVTFVARKLFPKAAWLPSGAPADTVQRHEFVRILLEWAAGQGVLGNAQTASGTPEQQNRLAAMAEHLRETMRRAGVLSPADALAGIQQRAVDQERAFPELPAHMWQTAAMIDSCPASFVGKITGWYDAMSARTSQRFTLQSRLLGSAVALAVVIALPLDSLDLLKKLSDNPAARLELVKVAEAQVNAPPVAGQPTPQQQLDDARSRLAEAAAPLNLATTRTTAQIPGFILSWVLLSLGTPFWYDALKNLLKLRSLLAQKDDKDRAERQNAAPEMAKAAPPAARAAAAAAAAGGGAASPVNPNIDDESGDTAQMAAVG